MEHGTRSTELVSIPGAPLHFPVVLQACPSSRVGLSLRLVVRQAASTLSTFIVTSRGREKTPFLKPLLGD